MRLLVTGATGFLGRHILAAATNETVFRATRATNAAIPGDIALGPELWTQADFSQALAATQPDIVIHCAGTAMHTRDARKCFDANVVLAAGLLNAVAKLAKPPRVILIGSAAEYGVVSREALPVAETHPCAPRTIYGVAKHAQSLLGFAFAMRGLPVLVARLFNPVGAGMPKQLALPSFARQIVGPMAQATVRVGDLSAERDFIDVEEAARLILALASLPHWPWPLVHICSGRAYRLGHLLDEMAAMSGVSVKIELDPALLRPGDMRVLAGSTKRLESANLVPRAPDFSILLPRSLMEARGSD